MMWVLFSLVFALAAIAVFLALPCSPLASAFKAIASRKAKLPEAGVFTQQDIDRLPPPVKRYFHFCGCLGRPKMASMKAAFSGVDFVMGERTIRIDYVQRNFVKTPDRFAYIRSSLWGIPFEGFDAFQEGTGSMKGVLGKLIPLFDQQGKEMDRACLATYLSECLIVPSAALQEYITWEAIDDTHARATITRGGQSASGVFTFNEEGAMLSFRTGDRAAVGMDGTIRQAEWSAVILAYQEKNGLKQPEVMQAVWHYPEGDCIYFNANKAPVTIEFSD